jgi:hypothetical protein
VTFTEVSSGAAIGPAPPVAALDAYRLAYMADGAVIVHSVALTKSKTRTQKRASASIWGVGSTISRRLHPGARIARASKPTVAAVRHHLARWAKHFTTVRGVRASNGLLRDGKGIEA